MSEEKSKKSIGIRGHDPEIGCWVCSYGDTNTYGFGETFKEAKHNFLNNIHNKEKEKYMIEKMNQTML